MKKKIKLKFQHKKVRCLYRDFKAWLLLENPCNPNLFLFFSKKRMKDWDGKITEKSLISDQIQFVQELKASIKLIQGLCIAFNPKLFKTKSSAVHIIPGIKNIIHDIVDLGRKHDLDGCFYELKMLLEFRLYLARALHSIE